MLTIFEWRGKCLLRLSEDKEASTGEASVTIPVGEGVSVPKFSKKKIMAGIMSALIVGLALGYVIGSMPIASLQNELQNLQREHSNLQRNYDMLNASYENLVAEYRGALKVPYTTIKEGNVTWAFKTAEGTVQKWSISLDSYVYYVNKQKPSEYHSLTANGKTFLVRKMELFVQPEVFSKEINDLTDGNTAKEFVQEVFNLRKQLTAYSSDITDTPQWSVETMTKGTGDCEDFAILMGSLIKSGSQHANYNLTAQFVYMDSDNPTEPQTVNHVMLNIKYQDGSSQLLDSTSTSVSSPWSRVVGWFFDL